MVSKGNTILALFLITFVVVGLFIVLAKEQIQKDNLDNLEEQKQEVYINTDKFKLYFSLPYKTQIEILDTYKVAGDN